MQIEQNVKKNKSSIISFSRNRINTIDIIAMTLFVEKLNKFRFVLKSFSLKNAFKINQKVVANNVPNEAPMFPKKRIKKYDKITFNRNDMIVVYNVIFVFLNFQIPKLTIM